MVSHVAVGILATNAGTWVNTLLPPAGLVRGTVLVEDALGLAVGRAAHHSGQTRAIATVAILSGRVAVQSARVWITRILFNHRLYN